MREIVTPEKHQKLVRYTRRVSALTLISLAAIPAALITAIWTQPKWQLLLTAMVLVTVTAALYSAAEKLQELRDETAPPPGDYLDEVRADAWEEGHETAAMRVPEGVWHDTANPRTPNPYRKEQA